MILTRSFELRSCPIDVSAKIGLRVHEARDRISKFGRHAYFRRRIFARAFFKVRCNCTRANKDEGCQHRELLFSVLRT